MMKVLVLVMLRLSIAMSSPTCTENAVVGHCLFKGCFMGHGNASCHTTQCICNPGTCSIDGKVCIPIPLEAGQIIKLHLADSSSPKAWLSFTATNNEIIQRWYHFMWFGYSYGAAVPLKLFDARSLLHHEYGSYADTWDPLTFAMQNVYGHGYNPYWLGAAARDGRIRTSYTSDADKMPLTFVKVGCNRYKLRNMYHHNHHGLYMKEAGHSWVSMTASFDDATIVSVWREGVVMDECGNRIPTTALGGRAPADDDNFWVAAACGVFAGATAVLVAWGVVVWRRRGASELKEELLAA